MRSQIRNFCATVLVGWAISSPVWGELVRVGLRSAPRSLDPRFATDASGFMLAQLTHCALVRYDAQDQPVAQVAETWRWDAAGRRLHVRLRDGYRFGDGSPVDAAAVAASYGFHRSDASPFAAAFRAVERIEVVNRHELVFHTRSLQPFLVDDLVVAIMPPAQAEGPRLVAGSKIAGCGPYVLEKATPQRLELTRNTRVPPQEMAESARLVLEVVRDESTLKAKLLKGELDLVVDSLGADTYTELERNPALQVVRGYLPQTSYLGFNMQDPLLRRLEVREAIAASLQREQVREHVYRGYARLAETFLPPENGFYVPVPPVTYDLAAAQKRVKAVRGTGPAPKLRLLLPGDGIRGLGELVQSDLQRAGFDVSLQMQDWAHFMQSVEKGRAQMWMLRTVGMRTPEIYQMMLAADRQPPHGNNRGRVHDPELEKWFAELTHHHERATMGKLYGNIAQRLAAQKYYVFLFHEDAVFVARRSLAQVQDHARQGIAHLLTRVRQQEAMLKNPSPR